MKSKTQKKGETIVPMPIYLPEEDHKALRIASIEEGRSATDIIRELVRDYLTKKRKRKGVK